MYVDPVIAGFVVGKESCSGVDSTEYWLIDFTWREHNPQIGDTLVLDDFKHTNVLKMKFQIANTGVLVHRSPLFIGTLSPIGLQMTVWYRLRLPTF